MVLAHERPARETDADLLVVPVLHGAPLAQGLSHLAGLWSETERLRPEGSLLVPRRPGDTFSASAVLLVNVERDDRNDPDGRSLLDRMRRLGAEMVTALPQVRSMATTAHLVDDDAAAAAVAFLNGVATAAYAVREPARAAAYTLSFCETPAADLDRVRATLARAAVVEESVAWVRQLTDLPGGALGPADLGARSSELSPLPGVEVEVWGEDRLRQERWGGLLAVGRGSSRGPVAVIARYRSPSGDAPSAPHLAVVGKGITFDSGGLSLKRSGAMLGMKADMAGGAAALGLIRALAATEAPGLHVLAVVPCAENLPGAGALLPGDVVTHRDGRTSEVVNTDCEGRLVMADAISWCAEQQARAIVDIATLTYATVAALGVDVTSVLGTDEPLMRSIQDAGASQGEPIWPLPLWRPYRRLIESSLADVTNDESKDEAGAITAALFLEPFARNTPWAHLDIGGTGYLDDPCGPGRPAGATGVMVRTLFTFLIQQSQHHSEAS